MTIEVVELANGLRIAVEPMPGLHSASIGIYLTAGGRHERVEQNGIAHFLEHMAFKGTPTRSALAIAEEIEDVGGYINAYTGKEMTAYYARVLAADVPRALGLLADIVLNPLFIHGFGWGAAGSAGATVIANICTDAYFVWFTLRHSSNLSIDPRTVIDRARRRLAVTAREVGSILAIGIPSAITNLTQSVGIVMINLFLLPYGTDAVAAMGIALKVIMIAVLVFVGFAFGAQPLIGYNYGARNMPRLRGILRFSYLFLSLFALVMTVVLSLSDRLLMGFFIEDATIITLGAGMLRVQLLSLVCVAVVMVTTCTFQSAGKAVGAFVLSISRQGVMLAITLFVGSRLAGYQGVIAAQAIADLLTAIVAVILFVVMLPELRSRKAR